MKMFLFLSLLLVTVGCVSYPVPRYAVSTTNVVAAKKYQPKKVSLKYTNDLIVSEGRDSYGNDLSRPLTNEINCRLAGPIIITDGNTFGTYIQNALRDELLLADILADVGAPLLSVHLVNVDFSTTSASWVIEGVVSFENRKKTIVTKESYENSFFAQNACTEIANNFSSVVKKFNADILRFVLEPQRSTLTNK